MEGREFKQQVLGLLLEIIEDKLDNAKKNLASIEESKQQETKSSAGDKHETGREMIQQEVEQARAQIVKAMDLKSILTQIDMGKKYAEVEFGSIVATNRGCFFISIGQGEIEVGSENCFAISPTSPLGAVLLKKRAGDSVDFLGKSYIVHQID